MIHQIWERFILSKSTRLIYNHNKSVTALKCCIGLYDNSSKCDYIISVAFLKCRFGISLIIFGLNFHSLPQIWHRKFPWLMLTLCMLCNFSCFCYQPTISKLNFSKNSFRNTIDVNGLDPQHSVRPDLDPNCWQRLSTDGKSHC